MEKLHGTLDDGSEVRLESTGIQQQVTAKRLGDLNARHEQAVSYAVKSQTHLWVAGLMHQLGDTSIDSMEAGEQISFDADSLLMPPQVGCYICEEPYSPRVRRRKCPGQPTGGGQR